MKDDYLWDRSGEPDLEVVRLERALRPARYDEPADLPAQATARRRRPPWLGPAMALVPIAAAAAALPLLLRPDAAPERAPEQARARTSDKAAAPSVAREPSGPGDPGLSVVPLAGSPSIDRTALAAAGLLQPGQWLVTDGGSRALIDMDIGEVRVGPQSRVRLVGSGPAEKRLELSHGSLHAMVNAPPRLFLVDLPSATAVDLGCEYELVVDRSGAGVLRVETGEVSLEGHGRESLVPAGSACETRPGHGPGTPYRADAPGDLVGPLRRFDFDDGGRRALDAVLAAARERDTLTLWHLVQRADGVARKAVLSRLAALSPPPAGVRIDEPSADDLQAWRAALEASW